MTITSMKDSLPYSITTNVYVTQKGALAKDKAARTGSWMIVQGKDNHSSVMIWTYSCISADWRESLVALFCGPCVMRSIQTHFKQDLQDYANEAERRQAIKDKGT